MKLEQIDTSTTAGKVEVMRLAAEGRRVAHLTLTEPTDGFCPVAKPSWNWPEIDYAIIAEPVGPDEVWVPMYDDGITFGYAYAVEEGARDRVRHVVGATVVRYVRSDK